MNSTLALDIGGANLKAAHADGWADARPFALWKSPEKLPEALAIQMAAAPPFDALRVTMTAELCDCFATKRQGVTHVLEAVAQAAPGVSVRVWLTSQQLVTPAEAAARPLEAAASNWLALAAWAAALHPRGASLLIDTGSTTTDLVRLCDGRAQPRGLTDTDRLATGELLYTGIRRTPVMALGPTIGWRGRPHALMAEHFATMADAHLLLGALPEDAGDHDTADGRPLTRDFAAARLLRMVGADLETHGLADAQALAAALADRQAQRVAEAAQRVAGKQPIERIIVSGSGASIAERAAALALPGVAVVRLAEAIGPAASTAACAAALLRVSGAAVA